MYFGLSKAGMRRLIMSPLFLVVVIAVAVGAMLWITQVLEERLERRADAEGSRTAEIIATAVVQHHLDAAGGQVERLSVEDVAHMRADVDQLRRDGLLLGLGVWRLDGTPLLIEDASVPGTMRVSAADRERARSEQSWMVHNETSNGRGELRVFLSVGGDYPDPDTGGAVVAVVLAHDELTEGAGGRLLRPSIWAGVILLMPLLGLVGLQRRLRRREREARLDSLTGLRNRRALHEDARGLLARATDRRPLALLLMDLGDFKSVNDTLGHAAGDELLQQVAATLRGAVRPGDLVVRLGGDEFAVLLTDLPEARAAHGRAEELLGVLRAASFTVQGVDLVVDASIGLALAPQHGTRLPALLQRAEVAMYQAKRDNRGTRVYDPGTDDHSVGQLELLTELRRALENGEFVLHYQPKVSLPDRQVTSVEALVRWQHPTRGLLGPGEFLPVLERSGLMHPLTRWVIREAVRQAASWHRAGMTLPVAVNISPRSLLDGDLPARVLATLLGAELPASFLELEITETAVMTDPARAAVVLAQLRARGIRVAIDDFGAGYTSLAHLRSLPISSLKLDRSLIGQLLERHEDDAVTRALIDLAHRLDLRVVAEGVETEAVLDRLAVMGCDEVQGYLISRPLPPAALEGWIAERGARTGLPAAAAPVPQAALRY
jgi:diguanylate cyclase (GGDEF)-like protein